MSLSKRTTTLAASTRSGEKDEGLRPVHRNSIGSNNTKGKGGRGSNNGKK